MLLEIIKFYVYFIEMNVNYLYIVNFIEVKNFCIKKVVGKVFENLFLILCF